MKKWLTIVGVIVIVGVYAWEYYLNLDEAPTVTTVPSDIDLEDVLPTSTTHQIYKHAYYTLSYNENHEQAEWVAYQLKASDVVSTQLKRPFFEQDPKVKTRSADWRNYKNSGYDKGHLCPAGDRKFSKKAYFETFLTSNISPQNHNFNAGVWNDLEQLVRQWALQNGAVWVFTGGVLEPGLKTIGKERVSVPKTFYKIVCKGSADRTQMIGFLIPNAPISDYKLEDFTIPIDSIETLTHIDFFPKISDSLELLLESEVNLKDWQFR